VSATADAMLSSHKGKFSNQRARSPNGRKAFSNSFLFVGAEIANSTIALSLRSLP
jgi:hypothetical protein